MAYHLQLALYFDYWINRFHFDAKLEDAPLMQLEIISLRTGQSVNPNINCRRSHKNVTAELVPGTAAVRRRHRRRR